MQGKSNDSTSDSIHHIYQQEARRRIQQAKDNQLAWLNLNGLSCAEFPDAVLPAHITALSLADNRFTELPSTLTTLQKLTQLDLRNNALITLPRELYNLSKLQVLRLDDNPLQPPILPEILARHDKPKAILDFYFAAQKSASLLREAKVLLVGDPEAGKTAVLWRLLDKGFYSGHEATPGVEVAAKTRMFALPGEGRRKITLRLWDFGGQEVMHATHQFFFTPRSVYLVVLSARQCQEEEKAEYWLSLIRALAGPDAPVIVVINKVDTHTLDVNRRHLQEKYGIQAFIRTSCQNKQGIAELWGEIERGITGLRHMRDVLPTTWKKVKNQLERMKNSTLKDFIEYAEYEKLCQQAELSEPELQHTLAQLLHDLGVVLHFDDLGVRETAVLNPEWVTRGVYQVLLGLKQQERCTFHARNLDTLLSREHYPHDRHKQFIVKMMQRFELCFPLPNAPDTYLIPQLLAEQQPEIGFVYQENCLCVEYRYPAWHTGLIPRFIVRQHECVYQEKYWRTGVVLHSQDERNRAVVIGDRYERCLRLWIIGDFPQRNFLWVLMNELEGIHHNIGLTPKKYVLYQNISVEYEDLLAAEKAEKIFYFVGKLARDVPLRELLDNYRNPQPPASQTQTNNFYGEIYVSDNSIANSQGIFNIQSELHQVQQIIGALPNLAPEQKTKATELMQQLLGELSKLPAEDAEAIRVTANELLEKASAAKPNRTLLSLSAKGLQEAAAAVQGIAPAVVTTVRELLGILKIIDG